MNFKALHEQINRILSAFKHPTLKYDLTVLKALNYCALLENTLYIELSMPFAWQSGFDELKKNVSTELLCLTNASTISWKLVHNITTIKSIKTSVSNIHNIIAISSGKGGVGKSSTAVNLALALAAEGGCVGLLDADIYGPSIPAMLGTTHERTVSSDGQHMVPVMAHGLATNSIGYMATNDEAIVWRGLMASKALLQLFNNTLWPKLDYLIVDMPPGTGDIQLTLAQNIPVTSTLIVTTPQDIALADARRGIIMFTKVGVPILGIVENMSMYICSNCGHLEATFGTNGAQKLTEQYKCALLGHIPLHINLREDLDCGNPTVIKRPNSELTKIYLQLANQVAAQLYWQSEIVSNKITFKAV